MFFVELYFIIYISDSENLDVPVTKFSPRPSGISTKTVGSFSAPTSQGGRDIRGPVPKFTTKIHLKSTDPPAQNPEAGKQSDLRAAANLIVNNGLFTCLLLLLINIQ